MKVNTDSVLLGAWAKVGACKNILDIGTGTGVIALMLAQRNTDANVLGIEIDQHTAEVADENFHNSVFSNRMSLLNVSVQDYAVTSRIKYDAIVSNPPYFDAGPVSNNDKRKISRHTETLTKKDLIKSVKALLESGGYFSVILPHIMAQEFIEDAYSEGLFLNERLDVYSSVQDGEAIRSLLLLRRNSNLTKREKIYIREDTVESKYTKKFISLTKAFYENF
ncbi:MAG: methyltransferase [Saprospiraceae bacterium]|nr:methyltransferase [Saprospiraceae bacterium]MCB9327526.1 methyltransferase [Lewinellaceae bacterium]